MAEERRHPEANALDYLSVGEMANELGVSQDKVRYWCRTKRLPSINVGDNRRQFFRVKVTDWEKFKASRSVLPLPSVRRLLPSDGTNLLGV